MEKLNAKNILFATALYNTFCVPAVKHVQMINTFKCERSDDVALCI